MFRYGAHIACNLRRHIKARICYGEHENNDSIIEAANINEEAGITMCELFDQYTRRGRKEGIRRPVGVNLYLSRVKF